MNDKKTLKINGPRTWCTKKPCGYRVAQHGYHLTSFLGLTTYLLNTFYYTSLKNFKVLKITGFYFNIYFDIKLLKFYFTLTTGYTYKKTCEKGCVNKLVVTVFSKPLV